MKYSSSAPWPMRTHEVKSAFAHTAAACCGAVLLLPLMDQQCILFWAPFHVKAGFHLSLKGQRRVEYRKSFNIGIKRFPVKAYSHDCSLLSNGESWPWTTQSARGSLKTKAHQIRRAEEDNTSLSQNNLVAAFSVQYVFGK